ncbi:hypothetical protein AK830_g4663 [Neonectria ditissima]|uniref:PD-(D/E)XK nuclease-like domain-containing protein n=1 Tax=Neonectria ditissima TaxID=78410 RepID=A0A0P7BNB7_9HYPO|nr:hypothetical protein AK830_g4663 [Neonectria ditissima]
MSLRLDDGGLECRQLKIDTAPSAATDPLAAIREIGNGLDILPHTHKATILESTWVKDQNMRIWSTTARPHSKYLPYSSPAKMVDFCLYLDDLSNTNALQALGRQTPTLTVNHTNFAPLQLSPIALSIETKRPGKELDAAQLQMGVWHAAQWKFLRSIVGLTGQPMSAAEEVSRRRLADEALAELGFIPGVIVQGHRWLFVCSTLEDRKTVLWTERQFGTTQSILDSYQIVAGLRELAGWIRDVYLPWFQSKVLSGLSDENET